MPLLFNAEALDKLVSNTVPADRTNAIVGTVDSQGVTVVMHLTKGERWSVAGAFTRDWNGSVTAGAKVIYSW